MDAAQLLAFQKDLVERPEYRTVWHEENGKVIIDKSFCNFGLWETAHRFDCHEFDNPEDHGRPFLANRCLEIMAASRHWLQVPLPEALAWAQDGRLAVAALHGERHGHVTCLAPLPPEASSKWQRDVPIVANVGGVPPHHGLVKESWAFAEVPSHHIFLG